MSPVDVLRMELRRLDQSGFVSSDDLRRVEARHWWTVDPATHTWEPAPSILS